MDFAVPVDQRVKSKESEKDKYLNRAREMKKQWKESDGDANCNWCSWYSHQRIDTRTGEIGSNRMRRDHPNYSFIKISQNIEKSPGDLRRLAFTLTLVRNYRLTPVWKTPKRKIKRGLVSNHWTEMLLHPQICSRQILQPRLCWIYW